MKIKVMLKQNENLLAEYPIDVEKEGDLAAGTKEAIDEFRRRLPDLSLFDDGVVISFDKLE